MPSILSVAQTGLAAAQIGLTTTGHNIANANTKGYTRQVVLQGAALGQDSGVGFVGKGTQVLGVTRVYDSYLATRVTNTQSSSSALDSYYTQIKQVNNLLSDTSGGLAPTLQDFFNGIQTLASDPNSSPARQSMLSGADQLVASFHSIDNQMSEIRDGVNSQIGTAVQTINSIAAQIAKLNNAIETATGGVDSVQAPNDLLDQRDKLIGDLSEQVKVTVVNQGNSYNVFIGNGQPMVVGSNIYALAAVVSKTDLSRAEIAYVTPNATVELAESAIAGGKLGGLFDFRSKTLDVAQNALGRIATGIAVTFNQQHQLGQDQTGAIGGEFFHVADPLIKASTANKGNGVLTGQFTDVAALTNSDYQLSFDGTTYGVVRVQDRAVMYSGSAPPSGVIDGVQYNLTGTMQANDVFLIRPTALGAVGLEVSIKDRALIAAAAPIRTGVGAANTGTGAISPGSVNGPPPTNVDLQNPVTITFTSPTTYDAVDSVTGTTVSGTYTAGTDITMNGWTIQLSGKPSANDTFTVGPNTNGVGDSRNALALASLQTAKTLDKGTASYQGVFGQLVSEVGNKTHELEVTSKAEITLLGQAIAAHEEQSGVNLDEEATNLIRYQQAYAAAGKVMATAQKMFDILLSLGAL